MAKKPARIDRRIDVILLESDKHLGEKYDMVKVKPIFAKNVLFPANRAILATTDAINAYKSKIEAASKTKEKRAQDLSNLFTNITNDNGIQFAMKTNEKWVLYEKIDPTHIAHRIKELYSISVDEHLFKMKKKIIQTGEFIVPFKYGSLEKDIRVVVKTEKENKNNEEDSTTSVA